MHPVGTCTHASFRSGVCPELLSSNNQNTKNGCLSVRAEWLDTIWCYTKLQTLTFEMAQQGPFDSREGKHCVTIIIPWASRVYEICTLRAVLCILPPGYKSYTPKSPQYDLHTCTMMHPKLMISNAVNSYDMNMKVAMVAYTVTSRGSNSFDKGCHGSHVP